MDGLKQKLNDLKTEKVTNLNFPLNFFKYPTKNIIQ